MAGHVLELTPVTVGLHDMLRNALGIDYKVEVGEAPRDAQIVDNQLVYPYAVIYPFPTFLVYGDLAHPDSGGSIAYQITSVGRTDDSAGIMADRVRRMILERTASGSFVNPISAGGSMKVIDRRLGQAGALTATAGLWSGVDLYYLEVQAYA